MSYSASMASYVETRYWNKSVRFGSTIMIAVISLIATYFGAPYIHDNKDASSIIVTVFTVFAGFLFAVAAATGDPTLVPRGNWRKAELRLSNSEKRLAKQLALFYAYVTTILLIFVTVLLQHATINSFANKIADAAEYAYLFIACFAFLQSFKLPMLLMKVQTDRLKAEVENRRQPEGN